MTPTVRTTAVLLVAAALRLLRIGVRWDEVTWQYAAYPGATVDALRDGDLVGALTTWVGLHPPGWQLLHAAQELLLPVPLLFLGTSAVLSWLAVWVWRDHPLVAWILATSPVQLAYSAEVNDYPLVALLVALAYRLQERAVWLGVVGAIACWTHPLAAVVVGLIALRRPRALALMALACLPLIPGVVELLSADGTFGQPELLPAQSAADAIARFGGLGLVTIGVAAAGIRRLPRLAAVLGASLLLYAGAVLSGVAAPHQFMYWLLFTTPIALLADASGRGRRLLVGVGVVQALWFGGFDVWRLGAMATEGVERGIDVALDEALPADAVYLLAPPGRNDDDKSKHSAVLWRLRPWTRMPMAKAYAFSYADHRHGQPRLVDDRFVYVNDALRPELDQAIAAHPTLFLVVYEASADLLHAVEARYGEGESVGPDRLWRLSSE